MAWAKNKGKKQENRLYLTRIIPLNLGFWLAVFKNAMLAATKIWNSCVWHSRDIKKNEDRWPGESEMKSILRAFDTWRQLHSQSAQATVEEYYEAVGSYLTHRENGHDEMRPPRFKNKRILRTITWKKQGFNYDKENNVLELKFSDGMEYVAICLPEGSNVLELPDGTVLKGVPVEVKVKAVYRGRKVIGLELHITWDFGAVPIVLAGKVSAYDVNASVVARTTSEGNQQLIVCRELLSLIQYRNKIIAEFQQKMSRCKEGSRRWKTLLRAKREALKKLNRRIDQLTNALTRFMAELDQAEDITFSVLGDLTDIRRKARTGDKTKVASQKINQLPFDQINHQHRYKSLMRQVYPDKTKEYHGSTTCYACGTKNKAYRVHRGLWACKNCKTVMQADLNGSGNNLKNYLFGYRRSLKAPVKLKSPDVYRWDKRYNKFVKVSPTPAA